MSRIERPAAICPCTGLTIPECSCKRCLEEQVRSFSPLMRRTGVQAAPPSTPLAARPHERRKAA